LGIGLASVAGCGGGPPYKTAKVSGKVVCDDGTPIKAASIRLQFVSQADPIDAKTPPKDGTAEIQADGAFDSVSTWKPGDGAILGKHKVCVLAFDEKGKFSPAVPEIYRNPKTTPLEVTVSSSGMEPAELKVKKK
jgi:hypothetical protein